MSIQIQIAENLSNANIWLNDANKKHLPKAMRRAMIRGGKKLQTEAMRAIRIRRALRARDIKKDYFKARKDIRGRDISKYSYSLLIRNKPIPMILLKAGSKNPASQKGIAVNRRKPVRVKFAPGRSRKVKGAFVAKGPKSSQYHVFRREGSGKGPIVKQSLPSPHNFFLDKKIRGEVEKIVGEALQKEFVNQFKNLLR